MNLLIIFTVLFSIIVTLILGLPTSSKEGDREDEDTLVLLHVLFRHGNRTPEAIERYPKDPYVNETYFPFGLGQLTNAGKQKEYSIGQALAQTYQHFLGPVYYPELVDATSTSYDRTKMSLQLVLASLFKPTENEMWDEVLEWQPVPYNYFPAVEDPENRTCIRNHPNQEIPWTCFGLSDLISKEENSWSGCSMINRFANYNWLRGVDCSNYVKLFKEYDQSDAQQAEYEKYKDIFDYIADSTDLTVKDYMTVYYLYFGLATEIEWGFDLPDWAVPIWPNNITEVALKYYDESTATPDLKRLVAGYFLKKVLDVTGVKISQDAAGLEEGRGKKLYLYSAHDNNLGQLLVALDVLPEPLIPTYGSYLVLEVHQIDGVYGIKILYQNYSGNEPRVLTLPNCDSFCPLDQFTNIVKDLMPEEGLCNGIL